MKIINLEKIIQHAESINDDGYARFIAQKSFDYYVRRVLALNLIGMEHVVDIGCGYGHWSLALSLYNKKVTGIDQHAGRIAIANDLLTESGFSDVEFITGNALQLPLADTSVDCIFCYGVAMFLDPQQMENEFYRVLKPNGVVYICTNSYGWWLELAIKSLMQRNWPNFISSLKGLSSGVRNVLPSSTTKRLLKKRFIEPKWNLLGYADEGMLCINTQLRMQETSIYRSKLRFLPYVIEFMLQKNEATKVKGYSLTLDYLISRELIAKENWLQFIKYLSKYVSIEEYKNDLPNLLNKLYRETVHIDRNEFLNQLYAKIVNGEKEQKKCVILCLDFVRSHFYHDFFNQPIDKFGILFYDPVVLFILSSARCGSSARFLYDLLSVAQFNCKISAGAFHTYLEVQINNIWYIAETDIYPSSEYSDVELYETELVYTFPEILDKMPNYINYNANNLTIFVIEDSSAFNEIKKLLVAPIFPSSGFFSFESSNNKKAFSIVKNDCSLEWGKKMDYGWGNYTVIEQEKFPVVEYKVRPQMVKSIYFDGYYIYFVCPSKSDDDQIVFDIYEFQEELTYNKLIGFISKNPPSYRVCENKISLLRLSITTNYISIVTRIKSMQDSFFLPSNLFEIIKNEY